MKRALCCLLLLLLPVMTASAQRHFVRADTLAAFGKYVLTAPDEANGWLVLSADNFSLSRFDYCGHSSWAGQLSISSTTPFMTAFVPTPDHCFVILSRLDLGVVSNFQLTKIDASGTVLWSKSYGDPVYTIYPYSLAIDQQNHLVVYGNVGEVGGSVQYNSISRLDLNGNLLSTMNYDQGGIWGGAIVTADNGVLFRTGDLLVKTAAAGQVEWAVLYDTPGGEYYKPVEVSDGYIIPSESNGFAAFTKINKQGVLVDSLTYVSNSSGGSARMKPMKNGNVMILFHTGTLTEHFVEVDKDLQQVASATMWSGASFASLRARDFCFTNNGQLLSTGTDVNGQVLYCALHNDEYWTDCSSGQAAVVFSTIACDAHAHPIGAAAYSLNTTNETVNFTSFTLDPQRICVPPKLLDLGVDVTVCRSTGALLYNHSGELFEKYLWSTGNTVDTIFTADSGTFILQVTDSCDDLELADTVHVALNREQSFDLGELIEGCSDSISIIHGPYCPTCVYQWNTGSTTDTIQVGTSGLYALTVTNDLGCITKDSVEASFSLCDCEIWMPRAFTPNKDGLNDAYTPVAYCDVLQFDLKVFNRWGQLIFHSDTPAAAWDGTYNGLRVPDGLYVYILNYRPELRGRSGKKRQQTGTIAVIR